MSVQQTNLVTPGRVGRSRQLPGRARRPAARHRGANTLWFALLALVFGYPVPLVAAVLMSDVRRAPRPLLAARLPPGGDPAGGRRAALAVLLRRRADTGVFNTILGWVGLGPVPWLESATPAMPSLVLEATWAAAGGTVIIYLAALVSVPPELYDAAEVDGAGILAQGLARHAAAPARHHADHPDPADHRHRPGLPRALPVHRRRARQRDADGAAARLPATPSQNTTGGDYGKATALSLMLAVALAVLSAVYFRLTRWWSDCVTETSTPLQPSRCRSRSPERGPGASRRRRPRRDGRGITSAYERATRWSAAACCTAACSWSCVVVALGPDPVAGQVGDHADPGHPAPPDGAVANGTDWANLRTAWVDIDLSLLQEHGDHRARLVGDADAGRGDRRLRAVDPAAAVGRVLYGLC